MTRLENHNMVERRKVNGNTLMTPTILGLVVLAAVLAGGASVNYYLAAKETRMTSAYTGYANELQTLSQEIAKNSKAATQGQIAIFDALTENRSNFDAILGYLINGNQIMSLPASPEDTKTELDRASALWDETRTQIDDILNNRDAMVSLRDIAGDLAITMSAIQLDNNKIVATMLLANAPANQVALAQRQTQLIERMSRSVDKIIELGNTKALSDSFSRDSGNFTRVLEGIANGNRELLLTASNNADVQASLTRIDELFRSVTTRMVEINARSAHVAEMKKSAESIYQNSGDVRDLFGSLAARYESTRGRGIKSPLIGLGCLIAALMMLATICFLIYREAKKHVGETAYQNEQNQAAILQLLDELADLADGDLRVQATVTESFTGAIADSINFSIDQMRELVSKINETSAEVSTAADQTKNSVGELSTASARQANEIASVSEAVNEMAVSIDRVSCNAAESSSVAERSVEIAGNGAIAVQNTIGGMDKIRGQIQETAKRIKRLGESSQEIGDIVSLINDIADQTNILSLNAAIQASMAGDAGKGFAVVADEVQRLAERSGAAAKQISALVKTIQRDTNEAVTSMETTTAEVVQGTRLAQDAGVSLGEIEEVSKSLADIIEDISDAARQQAASAGKISSTMRSIQEITFQTTEGTGSTATAVGNLANMTDDLRQSVTGFKLPG
ncbi:methyl-accepting chemotaxis protein [Pseudomonadales bacterium]|nr:methyl-accepting chemotaxis protein [Pseudomonadales bacterium]